MFILILYLLSITFGVNFYFLLSKEQKSQLKDFVILLINNAKNANNQYWNNVVFFSIFSILSYLTIWGLSNLNKYLQVLNIGVIVLKGFVFGLTTAIFFRRLWFSCNGIFFCLSIIKRIDCFITFDYTYFVLIYQLCS